MRKKTIQRRSKIIEFYLGFHFPIRFTQLIYELLLCDRNSHFFDGFPRYEQKYRAIVISRKKNMNDAVFFYSFELRSFCFIG